MSRERKSLTQQLLKESSFPVGSAPLDQLWALQLQYYRSHQDVFLQEYMGLHLADTQQ